MAKYVEIAEILRRRVASGEYADGELPALRKLAADMGVSYLTARQAMKYLAESGGLKIETPRPRVAFISAMWYFSEWHRAMRDVVLECGGRIRFITYSSATDPVISEAVNDDYDLICISLPDGEVNGRLLELMRKKQDRVVVLFRDLTEYGLRMVDGAPETSIELILDRLREHGVREVAALGRDETRFLLDGRCRVWHDYLERHGMAGEFLRAPHRTFAYEEEESLAFCRERFGAGRLPEAVFCLTPGLAMGLYRVCFERGVKIGRDISIFSFGMPERARLMTPALATVLNVGIPELLERLVREYMPDGRRTDKLRFTLTEKSFFEGESLR